jgi:hypothetical protein
VLASDVGVADADSLCLPVDVAPAQPEQLRLTDAGHRRHEDHDAKHGAEQLGRWWRGRPRATAAGRCWLTDHDVIRDRSDHRLKLGNRQELQVGRRVTTSAPLGSCRSPHRVLVDPAAIETVLHDRMKKAEDVAHGLRAEAGSEHPVRERLNVGGRDLGERLASERGRQVDPLHRLAILEIGLARALQGQLATERLGSLVNGYASVLDRRPRPLLLLVLQDAEATLGLDAGESVGKARGADGPDSPVQALAVARPPAAVVGPVPLVEPSRPVAALPGHARDHRAPPGRTREPCHARGGIVRDWTHAATLPWSKSTRRPTLRKGMRRLRVSW